MRSEWFLTEIPGFPVFHKGFLIGGFLETLILIFGDALFGLLALLTRIRPG